MTRSEIKESRTILRDIEAHLRQSHLSMGAVEESLGWVDVIYHPNSLLPALNYVTPRKKTAWVSGKHIQQGLDALNAHERFSRVRFAEGLYPPVFERSLRDLGLEIETETALMVYKAEQKPRRTPVIPGDVNFSRVDTAEGMAIWWYVWRNAFYDVMTSSVEPLLIGRDLRDTYFSRQLNLIMYRHHYPMGVIRITFHENTAHLAAQAMLKELRQPGWEKLVREVALDAAIREGAKLIFISGKGETERGFYRELGFFDTGSIVTYAEPAHNKTSQDGSDDALEQSILVV